MTASIEPLININNEHKALDIIPEALDMGYRFHKRLTSALIKKLAEKYDD